MDLTLFVVVFKGTKRPRTTNTKSQSGEAAGLNGRAQPTKSSSKSILSARVLMKIIISVNLYMYGAKIVMYVIVCCFPSQWFYLVVFFF